MAVLIILQDTVLKRSPLPSNTLSTIQKWSVEANTEIPIASFSQDGSHYKVKLGNYANGQPIAKYGFRDWYAYIGHSRIQQDNQITAEGKALIQHFEGLRLNAYQDVAGVWTIGYGSTEGVVPGAAITQTEAERLLDRDLAATEKAVAELVEIELSPNQFSALVSFAYNVGIGAFKRSTLLELLNAGMLGDAADQLLRWVKAGDKPIPGLVRRRAAERALFLGKNWKTIAQ